MFDDVTFEVILERMMASIPDEYDKREGSVIYLALAPIALEISLLYVALSFYWSENFADTASDDALERRCSERGLSRKPATYASLVLIHDADNLSIGTRFFAPDTELTYAVTEIVDETHATVTCEQPGSQGNDYLGEVIPLEEVPTLTNAQLSSIKTSGQQNEDVEDLRKRYFKSFSRVINCGNIDYYKEQVGLIDSVGGIRVVPVYDGPGTVKLVFINSSFDVPNSSEVDAVQEEVDPVNGVSGSGIAPIDHSVLVVGASGTAINISAIVGLSGTTITTIEQDVTTAISEYLLELKKNWCDDEKPVVIVASQIEYRIMQLPGVVDVSSVLINNAAGNLELDNLSVPVLGTVSLVASS